jgi:hypothetical protein
VDLFLCGLANCEHRLRSGDPPVEDALAGQHIGHDGTVGGGPVSQGVLDVVR